LVSGDETDGVNGGGEDKNGKLFEDGGERERLAGRTGFLTVGDRFKQAKDVDRYGGQLNAR